MSLETFRRDHSSNLLLRCHDEPLLIVLDGGVHVHLSANVWSLIISIP